MEQLVEKHWTANRPDIFVKQLPAPPSPGKVNSVPTVALGRLQNVNSIDQNTSLKEQFTLSVRRPQKTIPADHRSSIEAFIRFVPVKCRREHGNNIFSMVKYCQGSVSTVARCPPAVYLSTLTRARINIHKI
jgi:hypothetical protein